MKRARIMGIAVSILTSTVVAAPQAGVRRAEILAVAKRYAEFRWTPTKVNVFHGLDRDGVRVDTPDTCHSEAPHNRPDTPLVSIAPDSCRAAGICLANTRPARSGTSATCSTSLRS